METITYDCIREAAARLKGAAHRTPVMTSRTLNKQSGREIYLKCEQFQRGGAFKFRGAYNTISRMTEEENSAGYSPTHRVTMPKGWRWPPGCPVFRPSFAYRLMHRPSNWRLHGRPTAQRC